MALAFVSRANTPTHATGTSVASPAQSHTTGNLLVVCIQAQSGGTALSSVTDTAGNTYTKTTSSPVNNGGGVNYDYIYYAKNVTGNASNIITATWAVSYNYLAIAVYEFSGADTTAPFVTDSTGSGASTNMTTGTLSLGGVSCVIVAIMENDSANVTAAGTGYTKAITDDGGYIVDEYHITSTDEAATATQAANLAYGIIGAAFKVAAAAGIAFDAAANSADQAAANTYSGSASWAGTNRFLAVDVSMLGPGVNVTSMTYGGANCTFIGSKSTVTSLGSIEQWRITSSDPGAPAAGANTLVVNLSGTIEFTVEWVSYTGVHQTSPTESFNSNQATNAGSATDASVVVTPVANNCWVHAAIVANDTSITANQTTRNNIAGTLGSGANEDNNAAITPAAATTMSYTGMGLTTTWAIAGYAIRPLAAPNLSVSSSLTLLSAG